MLTFKYDKYEYYVATLIVKADNKTNARLAARAYFRNKNLPKIKIGIKNCWNSCTYYKDSKYIVDLDFEIDESMEIDAMNKEESIKIRDMQVDKWKDILFKDENKDNIEVDYLQIMDGEGWYRGCRKKEKYKG